MKNKTIQAIIKYKLGIIMFIIFGFLAGYFVTEYIVNQNLGKYEIELYCDQNPNVFFNSEFFENTLAKIDDYNKNLPEGKSKISYANIDYKQMIKSSKITNISGDLYNISIKRKYFPSTFKNSTGEVNEGINRCEKYIKLIFSYSDVNINYVNKPIVKEIGVFNPYILGLATAGCMLLLSTSFFYIVSHMKDQRKILVDISDNELIFKTPFHKKYWYYSASCFKKVKNITVIAILFALLFVCKAFSLPSGFGALGIGLTYLIFSVICMIYGPICGIVVGMFSDLLGFFVFQSGQVFFLGYTLDAMLAGFIYGLCFYRTKVTYVKCLYSRIIVNLFINVILGSIWWAIIYDLSFDGFKTYLIFISLPKNLVYLIPQSIIQFIILKLVARPCGAYGLIDNRISENISII